MILSPFFLIYETFLRFSLGITNSFVLSLLALAVAQHILETPFQSWIEEWRERRFEQQTNFESSRAKHFANLKSLINSSLKKNADLLVSTFFSSTMYLFLIRFEGFKGSSITGISDLSKPDSILKNVNLLPFIFSAAGIIHLRILNQNPYKFRAVVASILLPILLYFSPSAVNIFFIMYLTCLFFNNRNRQHTIGMIQELNSKLIQINPKSIDTVGRNFGLLAIFIFCFFIFNWLKATRG